MSYADSIAAIFFDRDGVLNVEKGYLHKIEDFEWMDGAQAAIKFCNENKILAIVVTNQSGIARGLHTEEDTKNLHEFMQSELKKIGAHIDGFYFCPHHPEGIIFPYGRVCDCRKPKPGMILQACKDFDIDPKKSFLIGDAQRDLDSAKNAGLRDAVFFTGGNLFDAVRIACEKIFGSH